MQETWVQSLGREDPLENGIATHSSILAWEIPWTEDLEGYSPQDHKQSDMTVTNTPRIENKIMITGLVVKLLVVFIIQCFNFFYQLECIF